MSVKGFFSGGGRTAKFPAGKFGTTISGVITAVHPPEPQTDFETGAPIPGREQIRIDLNTDQIDPDIEGDDGRRTLYVKGWMAGAIGDALRKAGVDEPAAGAKLSVTYIGDGVPTRPGLNGPKKFTAVYEPSGGFFMAGDGHNQSVTMANINSGNAPIPATAPAGIDPAAWASMPADAKQAVANAVAAPF